MNGDVALDLVEKYPDLARSTTADGRYDSALSTLARMSSAFPHGESFSFWHNFIYSCKSLLISICKDLLCFFINVYKCSFFIFLTQLI